MSRIESAKDYSANGEWGTMNNVIRALLQS